MLGLFVRSPKKTALVTEEDDFLQKYDSLATKLGVECRAKTNTQLSVVLAEEMIGVYDTAAVERYMDKKGYWKWYPLRTYDKAPGSASWKINRVTPTSYDTLYGPSSSEVYDKPVPYPVLCTVERLVDKMGPSVIFVVAALGSNPDPFLACFLRAPGRIRLYVIERWDEPGFRGK